MKCSAQQTQSVLLAATLPVIPSDAYSNTEQNRTANYSRQCLCMRMHFDKLAVLQRQGANSDEWVDRLFGG